MLTGLKIINLVEERVGYNISETLQGRDISPETRKLTNLLNHTLRVLQGMDDWPRLKANGFIQTIEKYRGTCAAAGVTVIDSAADFADDLEGAAVQFDEAPNYVYTVKKVTSSTTITLEEPGVDYVLLSSTEYTIAQDTYVLPEDFDRPIDEWKSFFGVAQLEPLDDYDFMDIRRQRNGIATGEPVYFTLATISDSDQLRVAFQPYPDSKRMYKFRYLRKHPPIEKDGDLVLYPERQVDAVVQAMIDAVFRDFEDDDRMLRTMQDSIVAANKALKGTSLTEKPLIITPSRRQKMIERSKWMHRGRRFSYGDLFDIVGFRTRG